MNPSRSKSTELKPSSLLKTPEGRELFNLKLKLRLLFPIPGESWCVEKDLRGGNLYLLEVRSALESPDPDAVK